MLRTTYAADEDGEPQPTVHDDLTPGWAAHDLSGAVRAAPAGCAWRCWRSASSAHRFDLSADSPLRITLVRTGADEYVMLLVAHHIAWDDGCWRVFFADLTRAYSGEQLGPTRARPAPAADTDDEDLDVLARGDGGSAGAAGTSRAQRVLRSRRASGRSAPRCDCPPRPSTG